MDFWNFVRNIFSRRNSGEFQNRGFLDDRNNYDGDNFGNQMWSNDVDIDSSRHFNGNNHFHIFTDPLQMIKYFESQMDEHIKNFIHGFNNESVDIYTNVFPSLPSQQKENLRDQMLKPNDQMGIKLDTDLDGRITADNFSNVWDEHSKPKSEVSRPYIFGRSVRKEYIRESDGTITQKQIVRDNEGNEEITVSHQIGDKIHTIVTKRDKNGVETKMEDFSELPEYDTSGRRKPFLNEQTSFLNIDLKSFPWENFFNLNPKS